jgi:hypothetical protein
MSYSFLLNSSVDNALTTIHDREFLLQEIIDKPQQPIFALHQQANDVGW